MSYYIGKEITIDDKNKYIIEQVNEDNSLIATKILGNGPKSIRLNETENGYTTKEGHVVKFREFFSGKDYAKDQIIIKNMFEGGMLKVQDILNLCSTSKYMELTCEPFLINILDRYHTDFADSIIRSVHKSYVQYYYFVDFIVKNPIISIINDRGTNKLCGISNFNVWEQILYYSKSPLLMEAIRRNVMSTLSDLNKNLTIKAEDSLVQKYWFVISLRVLFLPIPEKNKYKFLDFFIIKTTNDIDIYVRTLIFYLTGVTNEIEIIPTDILSYHYGYYVLIFINYHHMRSLDDNIKFLDKFYQRSKSLFYVIYHFLDRDESNKELTNHFVKKYSQNFFTHQYVEGQNILVDKNFIDLEFNDDDSYFDAEIKQIVLNDIRKVDNYQEVYRKLDLEENICLCPLIPKYNSKTIQQNKTYKFQMNYKQYKTYENKFVGVNYSFDDNLNAVKTVIYEGKKNNLLYNLFVATPVGSYIPTLIEKLVTTEKAKNTNNIHLTIINSIEKVEIVNSINQKILNYFKRRLLHDTSNIAYKKIVEHLNKLDYK